MEVMRPQMKVNKESTIEGSYTSVLLSLPNPAR